MNSRSKTTNLRDGAPRRRMARRAIGAAAGAVLTVMVAGPALAATMIAADAPTTVTIAPGATATVPVTIKNTGGQGSIAAGSGAAGDGMVFTAPPNTTFPAQSTVTTQYSSDGTTFGGNAYLLENCAVSNAGATLTCQPNAAPGTVWPAGGYFRFLPQVAVDAAAPADTHLAGSSNLTFTSRDNPPVRYTTSVGTLNIQTPAEVPTPIIAGGVLAASGVAGAGALGVLFHRRRRQVLSS